MHLGLDFLTFICRTQVNLNIQGVLKFRLLKEPSDQFDN
mgnify:CR=1 FL=1